MTPDIDDDNLDSYNSDDFERGLKPCKVKISEHNKRPKFFIDTKAIYEKRKGNNATSTQVIIC